VSSRAVASAAVPRAISCKPMRTISSEMSVPYRRQIAAQRSWVASPSSSQITTLPSTSSRIAAVASNPPRAFHSGAATPLSRIAVAPSSIVSPSRTNVISPVSGPATQSAAAGEAAKIANVNSAGTAELVLGHAVTGLIKVYDLWDYADEKRAVLEAREAHLAAVLAGGNVVPMPAARRAA
jgi:hypothetical protein